MAVSILPETVTKDILFKKAQERFQEWVKMYADPTKTAQWMYEDMSASCFCGCPDDDFPDDVKAERDSVIKYHYDDGNCSFTIGGIEVEVQDLRSMRESPRVGKALYSDICTICISYREDDVALFTHLIPNTWLYGSSTEEFDEGMPVHKEFINAAREYIKEHNITPELQKLPE